DAAHRRLDTIAARSEESTAPKPLAGLEHVRQHYPNAAVQGAAKEKTWQVLGRHLPEASPENAQTLTRFLPPLAPAARLVARDCDRYLTRRREPETRQPRPANTEGTQLRIDQESMLTGPELIDPILSCDAGWVALQETSDSAPRLLLLNSW